MKYRKFLNSAKLLKICGSKDFPESGIMKPEGQNIMKYHKVPNCIADAFIFENDEKILVVITGTKKVGDVLINIRYQEEIDPVIGACHGGFLGSAKRIHENIRPSLERNPDKKVVIIGHSLGGAVAKLLSLIIKRRGTVHTFGEPNTCRTKHGAENMKYVRIMNDTDFVARVPYLYNHGIKDGEETLVYVDRYGDVTFNPPKSFIWLNILMSKFLLIVGEERSFDAIREHVIDSYIKHLEAVVD